jgi:hypothetical protein
VKLPAASVEHETRVRVAWPQLGQNWRERFLQILKQPWQLGVGSALYSDVREVNG